MLVHVHPVIRHRNELTARKRPTPCPRKCRGAAVLS